MSMWGRIKSWFGVKPEPESDLPGFVTKGVISDDLKTTFTLSAMDNNADTMALFYGRKERADADVEEVLGVAAEASDDGHQVPRMPDAHHGAGGRDPLGRVRAPGVTGAQAGMEGEGGAMTEHYGWVNPRNFFELGRMVEDDRKPGERDGGTK